MLTPRLFMGIGTGLLQAGVGFTYDSTAYDTVAISNRVAPAGVGGECLFHTIYLVVTTYAVATKLKVTPYVDGVALATQTFTIAGVASSQGEVNVKEIGLSVPFTHSAVERLRYAPRGTWFHLKIETDSGNQALADQLVNECELEYEVVRETKVAITT